MHIGSISAVVGVRSVSSRAFLAALASSTMLAVVPVAAHAGAPLPVGGSVAQGVASIVQGQNATIVNQSSARAVVNWQSFDVAAGKSVVFNQPDAQSATLNRVTGNMTSTIAGQITSNGAVYLVNPNGIAITSTGSVNTAGGFVASTLDIADADFMAGTLAFKGNGASNAVTNAGHIATSQGAYVALLGGAVSNSGTINVPYGKVGLGSGESIALDLNGNGFMQVAVPTSLLTGSNALIDNSGSISASGGYVQLQAATVKDAIRNVINMSGSINADSATGDGGTIHLIGGADTASMAGTVAVSGTLSAQATGDTGNGGSIETSGALVNFAGLNINAASTHGKAGTWLLDPTDLTIDDTAATTINTALATTNVTLQTTATTATGAGVQSVGNGDIIVNSALAWDSTSTLSLAAYNNITINAAVTAPTGGLTLTAGNGVANTGVITDTASLNIGTFNLTNGNWSQNSATLPSFSATDFRFNPATATFLRVVGGNGATATPYQIADVYGLQGIASGTLQTSNVLLVNNIDASGTSGWNAGAGFDPIGTDGAGNVWDGTAYTSAGLKGFSGVFNGNGSVVSNLVINRSSTANQGLFGVLTGSIGSLGLTNVNVTGGSDTGGLVGYQGSGTVSESYTMGTVSGVNNTGGLVGASNGGSITTSYSGATVSATGSYVGGLIGTVGSGGSITASYATGNVSTTLVGGSGYAGGLIGYYISASTINAVYATGKVTSSTQYSGGLIGYMAAGALTNGTASGAVSGSAYVAGLIGLFASAGSVSTSSATGNVTATGNSDGGLIGGMSAGLVSSSTASGTVRGLSATGGLVGGLSGAASISASSASGAVTGTGTVIGGLVGNAAGTGTISASFATGSVSGATRVGGLIGAETYTTKLSTSYATGNVSGTTYIGGLIGYTSSTGATDSVYSSGNVTGTGVGQAYIGGLIGYHVSSTISNAYSVGSVTAATSANYRGGLIGYQLSGTVTNVYATGFITGGNPLYTRSLIGYYNSGTISNGYYDSYSTGLTGPGVGTSSSAITNINVVSSDPARSGTAGYAFNGASYTNLPSAKWVFLPNARPILAFQTAASLTPVNGVVTLSTAAQLATISASTTTLGQSYTLSGDINLAQGLSGSAIVGMPGTYAGVFANGFGLTPIGTLATPFTGTFNGGGFTISGLNIITSSNYAGLFGYSTGAISNLTVAGTVASTGKFVGGVVGYQLGGGISNVISYVNVSGFAAVGGIAGSARGINLTNSSSSGTISGTNEIGGLAGEQVGGTWIGVTSTALVTGTGAFAGGLVGVMYGGSLSGSASGTVSGALDAGGLVGYQQDSSSVITGASSSRGTVTGTSNVGGLVGYAEGSISNSSSSYLVSGTSDLGGLVGRQAGGAITNASATGSVTGGDVAGSHFLGGLIGYQDAGGSVTNSSSTGNVSSSLSTGTAYYIGGLIGDAHGSITGSSASGNVGGSNTDYAGGLVGLQAGANISTSKASGTVTGQLATGGLVGYTVSGSIDQAYASGAVTGGNGGISYAGGLIGFLNAGTITNVYATGAVGGTAKYAGGLIGYQLGGSIAQAYATGNISSSLATGGVKLGGLIGYQQAGSLTNGLWDTQTTGMANGFGYQKAGATFSGTGLTTLQAQDFANYATTYPGFDFTTIWTTPNQAGQNGQATAAYPTLRNRP